MGLIDDISSNIQDSFSDPSQIVHNPLTIPGLIERLPTDAWADQMGLNPNNAAGHNPVYDPLAPTKANPNPGQAMRDKWQNYAGKITPQQIGENNIDANGINMQASKNANVLAQQNVNAYNSALAANRGVNPTLAAQLAGNNLSNTNAQQGAATANIQAQNTFGAAQANQRNEMQRNMANQQYDYMGQQANQQSLADYYKTSSENYNSAQGNASKEREGAYGRQGNMLNNLLGAGGGVANAVADVFSDENLKDDISGHSIEHGLYIANHIKRLGISGNTAQDANPTAEDFLNTLTPKHYEYKPGSAADDGGKPRLGITAQNLEKTPEGQSLVHNTPNGKMVDTSQLALSLAGALGNIHERLKRIGA